MDVTFFPRTVGIEIVRGCNFSCTMCPVPQNKIPIQFMELATLQAIVDELDRWPTVETIWFFNFGEPLLHPQYRECLEILYSSQVARRAKVIQHTNASCLTGDMAEAILEIPIIDKLVFSFDGLGDKESYERYRGKHYDDVLENIKSFAAAAKIRRPELTLATCTIIPDNSGTSADSLDDVFGPIQVAVERRNLHDYNGNSNLKHQTVKHPAKGGCSFIEEDSLYIAFDGTVQPCCAVIDKSFAIGNIKDADFGDILNSKEMKEFRHMLRLDRREEIEHCRRCTLSIGMGGDEHLKSLWMKRDRQFLVDDAEERKYIFGEVLNQPDTVTRVDLGCGLTKLPGFIGVDRFPMPGVDVIADLDGKLPFEDNSVDLVYASHSLEHVDSIMNTIREIYRICKHGAQICIVSPYYFQGLNLANSYHKQTFNEHTPRFWTHALRVPVPEALYRTPHAVNWGLSMADNSDPGVDIRCVRMEFFYFAKHLTVPEEERLRRLKTELDVCDQIMYHLVVVKEDMSDAELNWRAQHMDYFEPPYVTVRRLHDQQHVMEHELREKDAAIQELNQRSSELDGSVVRAQTEIRWRRQQLEELQRLVEEISLSNNSLQSKELQLQVTNLDFERQIEKLNREIAEAEAMIISLENEGARKDQEIVGVRATLAGLEAEGARKDQEIASGKNMLEVSNLLQANIARLSREILTLRSRMGLRLIDPSCFSPSFQKVLEASILQSAEKFEGYSCGAYYPLAEGEILAYPVRPEGLNWCGIRLAAEILGRLSEQSLALEILSEEQTILRTCWISQGQVKAREPLQVRFEPISPLPGQLFWVRVVGASGIEAACIIIYEWQRYSRLSRKIVGRRLLGELTYA